MTNWQPMNTAPTDGSSILCAWFDGSYAVLFWNPSREAWSAGDGGWGSDRYRDEDCPNLWMALQPLPERVVDQDVVDMEGSG